MLKILRAIVFFSICFVLPAVYTQGYAQQCDQIRLDASQSTFVAMLEEREEASGILSFTELSFTESDYQNAALQFVRLSEACYHSLSASLNSQQPVKIDDGALIPVLPFNPLNFTLFPNENKWGASEVLGTPGGTVSYSFMANGVSIFDNGDTSTNTSITGLANYQVCFKAEVIAAFAAWSAVSDINFVEVADSGLPTNNPGASGLIRIGAHPFDGSSGVLAHAWAPLLQSLHYLFADAGDLHFDTAENWTCDTSGIDIGVVTIHEIGHSIGLGHSAILSAIMYPFYNPGLTGLDADDIAGAVTLYGPNVVVQPDFIFIKYGEYSVPILKSN